MEGQPIMITVETCLPLVLGTFCELLIAYFLEQLCSCYFPFLLSAKCYYVIKIRWLRTILISPQITRSSEGKTAFEDRNKLPLIGCIYIHCRNALALHNRLFRWPTPLAEVSQTVRPVLPMRTSVTQAGRLL